MLLNYGVHSRITGYLTPTPFLPGGSPALACACLRCQSHHQPLHRFIGSFPPGPRRPRPFGLAGYVL